MVVSDLAAADLGDKRRTRRLQAIAKDVAAKPATPFPRTLANEGDLEGFYRFVRNEAVTFEGLLEPHVAATVGRMVGSAEALAAHDTTEFRFGGTREGLGQLNRTGHGFLGHFTLAVSADGSRIPLNIVAVHEANPPPDEQPVEWLLLTTEPIDTTEQILKVVDHYRGRWRIEEYFKALKTGCAFEKRQLASWNTLTNALAIFIPIAWSLLRLRTVARIEGSAPARNVLTELEEKVLRAAVTTPLPRKPTTRDVMMAIARLGGHLRSNGEPGWLVLGRGYQDLLMMVAGYRLAMVEK